MHYSHKVFIILCFAGTTFGSPALAEDIHPAVKALLDNMERQTAVKPAYETIETAADGTITISRLTLSKRAEGNEPSLTMRIDEAVLSDISDEGQGLYEIGDARLVNINADMSGKDFALTFNVPEAVSEDWYVTDVGASPTPEGELRASMNIARKIAMANITVAAMGQTYKVDSYQSTWDGDPQTGSGTFETRISNIAVPAQAIELLDQAGMLKQLGYSSLAFDIEGKGETNIDQGLLAVSFDFGLTGRDMGTLRLSLAADGVPMAAYAELQKARSAGTNPNIEALLPKLQDVSFSGLSLRFEDLSITRKLLPMLAAMQGTDEATMVGNAGAMLQMGLMQLQNQAFATQASAAVSQFLKEPKSITIAARPAEAVKVSDLMAMNPAAPGEVITRLGVTVTAND